MPTTRHRRALVGPAGPIASRTRWATTFGARLRGVIGRPLTDDEALVIERCRRVHTFGVRDPLDVVFCDRDLLVLQVETLAPGSMSRRVPRAYFCIELKGGRAAACGVAPGVRLRVR